jgi:hypothetical protein
MENASRSTPGTEVQKGLQSNDDDVDTNINDCKYIIQTIATHLNLNLLRRVPESTRVLDLQQQLLFTCIRGGTLCCPQPVGGWESNLVHADCNRSTSKR